MGATVAFVVDGFSGSNWYSRKYVFSPVGPTANETVPSGSTRMSGTLMPSHGSTLNVLDVIEYGWADGGVPWRWEPRTEKRYVPAGVCAPRPVSMSESKASKLAVHFHWYEPV